MRSVNWCGSACMFFLLIVATAMTAPAQIFTTLVYFKGPNGGEPFGTLVQGSDGNLYGTTGSGGANNHGTVFKMTPEGALTTLYSFCSQPNCTDGSIPYDGLVQGTDGNFYGTTTWGGSATRGHGFQYYAGGHTDHAT